jgi:hypothetical protein
MKIKIYFMILLVVLTLGNSCKKALDAPKKAPRADWIF